MACVPGSRSLRRLHDPLAVVRPDQLGADLEGRERLVADELVALPDPLAVRLDALFELVEGRGPCDPKQLDLPSSSVSFRNSTVSRPSRTDIGPR